MPTKPPTFRPPGAPLPKQANSDYDRRRGSAHSRGYTAALRASMDAWKRANPLCLGCTAVGRVGATEVTDHILPHKGDKALLWSVENWQPSCREHHDIVKQRLEDLYASGKATAADLRLDSVRAIELTRDLIGD